MILSVSKQLMVT